ncbi:MAG TPA: ABC transporter substrate-binding protein [Burkholderiales bacterium]|nr:ABC transporter substrate-binding protein [Burkholderiales bacterium]
MKRDRRALLGALAAVAVGIPFEASAQSVKAMPRIGFLDPGTRESLGLYELFLAGMKELGYLDGKNVSIQPRFANGDLERLPALAKELADLKPDVILAQSTPGVRAVVATKTTTPIVMVAVGDPVGSGFVASLGRPGGNVTGMSILTSDVSPKLLELLKTAMPKLSRVAVLVNSANANSTVSLKNIEAAARSMDLKVLPTRVSVVGELDAALAAIAKERPDALLIPGDPLFRLNARKIAALALRHKLPLASTNSELVEAGGLFSYGASIGESYRRAAAYVDKILKGAKPADLPVEQSSKFELVINAKTAAALGLKIPQSMRITAEKVIE